MDKNIQKTYNRLLMTRDRISGATMKEIAEMWGVTVRTASNNVNNTATACMRQAMAQTQGDPDHPSTPRFTVEEFTTDPRAAMVAILLEHISAVELKFPGVKE